jgi:hypothetical protein
MTHGRMWPDVGTLSRYRLSPIPKELEIRKVDVRIPSFQML